MRGKLYGVSVGPGDPGLMTLRAVEIIEKCSVIAAPQTVDGKMFALSIASQVVDMTGKEVVPLEFLMTCDKASRETSHNEIARKLAAYLDVGKNIAMLNIGDISVYSTFSYIAKIIVGMGFEIEVCAGVPSFCAAAAELKIPLTEQAKPLIIIPAQCPEAEKLIALDGSKVIMKSGRLFFQVRQMIEKRISGKKIYAVENCGLENQRKYADLSEAESCGYYTTIIIEA